MLYSFDGDTVNSLHLCNLRGESVYRLELLLKPSIWCRTVLKTLRCNRIIRGVETLNSYDPRFFEPYSHVKLAESLEVEHSDRLSLEW